MFFAFIVVVCLVAALGGAQARKIKLPGLDQYIVLEGFPSHLGEGVPAAASPNSLRRLADGAAATAWQVTTAYSDDKCTQNIVTMVESYGQCLIDYVSGVAQSTSYVMTATVSSDGSATTSMQAYSDNTCTVKNGNPTSGTIPVVTTCTQAGLYYAKISTTSTNPTPGFLVRL